jgi:indoleamine 2,3-dioxygenase
VSNFANITIQRLPPQITCPLLQVSERLGLPPTATYSTLNLWNWERKTPNCDITEPDNLRSLQTATGTRDEEWFYLISVSVEAKGGPLILTMLRAIQAVHDCSDKILESCLQLITQGITELGALLNRMREHCDPQIFYHVIRPLLAGSKGMASAGLPRGVFYDEGNGKGQWREYSGGSNAQSSLIQLFDIILGVDHHATGTSSSNAARTGSFIQVSSQHF